MSPKYLPALLHDPEQSPHSATRGFDVAGRLTWLCIWYPRPPSGGYGAAAVEWRLKALEIGIMLGPPVSDVQPGQS
jgi:hypothetical protein